MNDEPAEIDANNFDTLSADGAYVNFKEAYVRFLLYRDVSIPEKQADDSVKFGETRREILQEIRMPFVGADFLRLNLDVGMPLYARQTESQSSEHTSRLMQKLIEREGGGQLFGLISEFAQMFWAMDDVGKEMTVAIFAEFVDNNKRKLLDIAEKHPAEVKAT